MSKGKIIVAMSGGVDSSVAAGILIDQGYEVIGINIRTWEYEAPSCDTTKKSCCSPEDIRDARDVGLSLGIPFYVVKMENIFGEKVIGRFISDYQNGLTPNPCVECNTHVKFGSLLEKARNLGVDRIATGHYAQLVELPNGRIAIADAVDKSKNQAYYLYGLSQDDLRRSMFPLGGMTKAEVREIARKMGLSTADKPESQEICFIPENDYRAFLKKKNIEFTPGFFKLVSGEILGKHSGKENFTIGQRKGLGISWKNPLYVISISDDGTVYLGEEKETISPPFFLRDVTFQGWEPMEINEQKQGRIQIRYRHTPVPCKIERISEDCFKVEPLEELRSVAPGQSATLYPMESNYLALGGIISLKENTVKIMNKAKEVVA
jgi:tRNA-specific 2-thiouridylase